MENQYIHLMNGFEFIDSNLQIVYGERGSLDYNIDRYFLDEHFFDLCRNPKSIEDIPEVSFEDIKHLCKRETYFQNHCRELIRQYDSLCISGKDSDDAMIELAGFLGICPGTVDWTEALFPHMVDLFVSSEAEGRLIWNNVIKNKKVIGMLARNILNSTRENHIIEDSERTFISTGYSRNFFRGENAYYKSSKASMFRKDSNNSKENTCEHLVSALKVTEFALFLQQLSFVNTWPYGNINNIMIAQHYGIPTAYVDFTSDIKTSLFFACCKPLSDNMWRPLQEDEYVNENARSDVSALGGDSRYGILHIAPADISLMMKQSQKNYPFNIVHPIGILPFVRSNYQSGFYCKGNPDYDVFSDLTFNEVKFRLTPDICKWIFQEMDEGKRIYPNESFSKNTEIINELKISKRISAKAFEAQMSFLKKNDQEISSYMQLMDEFGYGVDDGFILASESTIREIDREFWKGEHFQKLNAIVPTFQPYFCI